MRRVVRAVGYGLAGLALGGLLLRALMAAAANEPVLGLDYRRLPVGTYLVLAIFGVAALVGAVKAVRAARGRRRPDGRP